MNKVYVFDVKLPNNGWEGIYESEIVSILNSHKESFETRGYTLSNERRMTVGVLTRDSVYQIILKSLRIVLGLEVIEVSE